MLSTEIDARIMRENSNDLDNIHRSDQNEAKICAELPSKLELYVQRHQD